MPPLAFHARALLLSLVLVIGLAAALGWSRGSTGSQTIDIGIEHTTPLTLQLTMARRGELLLAEVAHDGSETVLLSVPEGWVRTEVRNVPLAAVSAEAASMGFVRWQVPAHARVSFRSGTSAEALRIHNPSAIPLTIRTTIADLATGNSSVDAVLVKEGAVTIPLSASRDER